MKPRVDFYLLADEAVTNRLVTACRLIEKAYHAGHHIYVHTEDAEQANQLDTMLWTFRDISFVPHALYDIESAELSPIRIGYNLKPTDAHDLLINLTLTVPDYYQQFRRIIEIVDNNETVKQQARTNYKIYKQADCELHSHQLEK